MFFCYLDGQAPLKNFKKFAEMEFLQAHPFVPLTHPLSGQFTVPLKGQ
jgi:hypothetical protein